MYDNVQYVIVEGIGRRDNREVYKYKNKESGTIVAVRSLLLQSEGDFGVPWPTIRKISLLKEIQHPNVAR